MNVNMDMDKEDLMFTLDNGVKFIPAKRCLIANGGGVLSLSENSYRFLLMLLKGETDKQNLINFVWSEQRGSVSESSYYGQLYLLRKSFSLVGLPNSLIKTIPKKGVKYVGYVSSEVIKEPMLLHSEANNIAVFTDNSTDEGRGDEEVLHPVAQKNSDDCETLPPSFVAEKNKSPLGNLYQSRSWHIFVTTLAVLAVCWLSTLIFFFMLFFTR